MTAFEIPVERQEPGATEGPEVEGVFRNSTYESERAFFRGLPRVGEGIGPAHIESIVDMADMLKREIDELRRFVVAISNVNGILDRRLDAIRKGNHVRDRAFAELNRIVLALQPCPEIPAALRETQPTLRVRIAHAHTLKEGWRLSETTVEWEGPANEVDGPRISEVLDDAFVRGEQEARERRAIAAAGATES